MYGKKLMSSYLIAITAAFISVLSSSDSFIVKVEFEHLFEVLKFLVIMVTLPALVQSVQDELGRVIAQVQLLLEN